VVVVVMQGCRGQGKRHRLPDAPPHCFPQSQVEAGCRASSDGGGRNLYADALSVAADRLVEHPAVNDGKERVISTFANVATGVNARAALADNDGTRLYCLTPKALDPQALALAVPAVSGTANAFLVCHGIFSLSKSPSDACAWPNAGRWRRRATCN